MTWPLLRARHGKIAGRPSVVGLTVVMILAFQVLPCRRRPRKSLGQRGLIGKRRKQKKLWLSVERERILFRMTGMTMLIHLNVVGPKSQRFGLALPNRVRGLPYVLNLQH